MSILGDAMDLPRAMGPYMLLRRLAVGGMAEVYVAKTRGIGGFEKLVAIKVIHPRFSEDEHFIQMLVEEAKISVLLTHVNIAQIFDLGCIDDTYFIVMEYIEGADTYRILRRTSDRNIELPFDICAYLISEVCHGLDHAHRKRDQSGKPMGIVHRDISPQNVLVSYAGEVKIVDFGIAKAALRSGQTEAGVIKGKYYYMSPEQAWGDPMDHRSDIFSTGVVLYELLTGEMLYREDNVPLLLDRVRKAEIEPPETRRAGIPKELSAIVMKALKRKADDRFQSAHEMAQALTQFLYKSSPSFTAARVAELMASIFEDEQARRPTTEAPPSAERPLPEPKPPASALPPMSRDEFQRDPTKSVIFDLSSDEGEEQTRTDLSIGKAPGMTPRPAGGRSAGDSTAVLQAAALERESARREASRREDQTRPLPAVAVPRVSVHDERTAIEDEDDDDDSAMWGESTVVSGEMAGAAGWDEEEEATMVEDDGDIVRKAQELYRRKTGKAGQAPASAAKPPRSAIPADPSIPLPSESRELARRRPDGRVPMRANEAAPSSGSARRPSKRPDEPRKRRDETPVAANGARSAPPKAAAPREPEAPRRPAPAEPKPKPKTSPTSGSAARPGARSSGNAAAKPPTDRPPQPQRPPPESTRPPRDDKRNGAPAPSVPPLDARAIEAAERKAQKARTGSTLQWSGAAPPAVPLSSVPPARDAKKPSISDSPPRPEPEPARPNRAWAVPSQPAPPASMRPSTAPVMAVPVAPVPGTIPPSFATSTPSPGLVPSTAPPSVVVPSTQPPAAPAQSYSPPAPTQLQPVSPYGPVGSTFDGVSQTAFVAPTPSAPPSPGLVSSAPVASQTAATRMTPDPFQPAPSTINTADVTMPKQRTWLKMLGALFVLALIGVVVGVAVTPKEVRVVELQVQSTVPGATVKIDGREIPQHTPASVTEGLVAGTPVRVEVTMPGYRSDPEFKMVTPLSQASALAVMFYMLEIPATMTVETDPPGASIFIDGIQVGTSPLVQQNVTVGRTMAIRATAPGRIDANQTFTVQRGQLTPTVRLTLPEAPRRRRRGR